MATCEQATGNVLESCWCQWTVFWHNDPVLIGWIGSQAFLLPVYALFASLAFLLDTKQAPAFLHRYKIQKNANMSTQRYVQIATRVTTNMLFVHLPSVYLWTRVLIWRGVTFDANLPSFFEVRISWIRFI